MNRGLLLWMTAALSASLAGAQEGPTPARTIIQNTAHLNSMAEPSLPTPPTTDSPTVQVTVAPVCSVTISPPAQQRETNIGTPEYFDYTVTNTGNQAFTFTLDSAGAVAAHQVTPERLTLDAGQSGQVRLQLRADQVGTFESQLTAACPTGEQATATAVLNVSRQQVSTTKAVDRTEAKPGDILTYTITVHNPNAAAVQNVTVTDTLEADVQYLSATPAPISAKGQDLTWLISDIPAYGNVSITLQVQVTSAKDALQIRNVASSFIETDPPHVSEPVITTVWDGKLNIVKTVNTPTARLGDHLTYTVKATNASLNANFASVTIRDELPLGLLVDATTLRLNGQPARDLNPDPRIIEVTAEPLNAGKSATLQYTATVTAEAEAAGELKNVALAKGIPATPGTPTPVVTEKTSATVRILRGEQATLIGRVYYDRDENSVYGEDDSPVPGARILIAGIGGVVTDQEGRYGIRDLRAGRYGMTLQTRDLGGDPVPYKNDYALSGSRIADVWGLTTVDFPLKPAEATLTAQRWTRVYGERLTVDKSVRPTDEGLLVTLDIQSTTDASVFINDPLPTGAALQRGKPQDQFSLRAGERAQMTYLITGELPPEQWLTDPEVISLEDGQGIRLRSVSIQGESQ